MNRNRHAHRAAVGLALIACGGLPAMAQADAVATATLSHLTVQVVDLDPNDGVPAEAIFSPLPYDTYVHADATSDGVTVYNSLPGTAHVPLSITADTSFAASAASTSAGSVLSLFRRPDASATASASGAGSSANAQADLLDTFVTLTKNTLLIVSGYGEVQSSATTLGETADATVGIMFSGIDGQNYRDRRMTSSVYGTHGTSQSHTFTMTYASSSTSGISGDLSAYVDVRVASVATAVPEPASAALLIGGLLLVGGARAACATRRPSA